MIKNKSVLALIPARGGSKGIPGKNIKPLLGIPLIAWTIRAAQKSKYIDRIIVSTDCLKIKKTAQKFRAEVPFSRPKALARDSSSADDVVSHALSWLGRKEKKQYDILALLQPTSPLRNNRHIDEALEKFITAKQADSLITVKEAGENPFWMKKTNKKGYLLDFIASKYSSKRRQDLPVLYIPQGAIYLVWTDKFKEQGSFYAKGKSIFYLMKEEESVDIDDLFDFRLAEFLLKSK
ncbi:acylneuraminate cytidylyltransferase family protein, partial [Patescibacteria group bacterium]|nr:acylneuraminate cytidylyltransferase family protein [Patescibacteria group bacterium]